MRSLTGLFCAVALIGSAGVVVCVRDVETLKSGLRSRHVYGEQGLRKMLQSDAPDKDLLDAVSTGNVTSIEAALKADADLDILDEVGIDSPLIRASRRGFSSAVQLLLAAGADVNFPNKEGTTALHAAAGNGHTNIVEFLLKNGADQNSEDSLGQTPLVSASFGGHVEIVEILIDAGSDIEHQDKDGWTPLHAATQNGHLAVLHLLLQKGAETEVESSEYQKTPMDLAATTGESIVIQILIDAGADKDHRNSGSYTPLIYAAYWGHQEAIKVLVENGADKTVVSAYGLNARGLLCWCTRVFVPNPDCDAEACEDPEDMEKLLDP